jgi:Tat protein secretion system quality control protein TatD with DNase activity
VGLDHTADSKDRPAQETLLREVLTFLDPNRHLLVLHCRGAPKKDATRVYTRLQSLLTAAKVSRSQNIHLHCFNGSRDVLENWLLAYPGTRFGFTRMAANFNRGQQEALRAVSDDSLLLDVRATSHDTDKFSIGIFTSKDK